MNLLLLALSVFATQDLLTESFSNFNQIDALNQKLRENLVPLLETKYFRYYKIDLYKGCPFWNDDFYCVQKDCAVESLENEDELPKKWRAQALSAVDFTFKAPKENCKVSDQDFCFLDDEKDAKFVNLLQNPERFTGYSGPSAARIWQSIYQENCFKETELAISKCIEKRTFYKLVSGLHASISTHICLQMLDRTSGKWYSDLECYNERVGNHPDRLENLYFVYSVVTQAINKASDYLMEHEFCSGSDSETLQTKTLLNSVISGTRDQNLFDPEFLFNGNELKLEFRDRFRNISRIMDCVSCEKCRLWGKLQISGLATALKILFSFEKDAFDYKLTRTEITALFNVLGRLSSSVNAKKVFKRDYSVEIFTVLVLGFFSVKRIKKS